MKLAIAGSRDLYPENLEDYLPEGVDEIVSGGARGVDTAAVDFARKRGLKLTEFLPDYSRYGRGAPLKRNDQIAAYADALLAFPAEVSRGTNYTIKAFRKLGKPVTVVHTDGMVE